MISIGNLHWGGSGKTPLTARIAAHLRDRDLRVAILSRGYKSQGSGVRLVSDWREGPLLGALAAGDEPVLLAGELPGVAVVVGPARAEAGRVALQRLDPAPDLFLLDDGFSHLRLHRDLDLLAFPMADPLGGGRLPPAGRLREPLASSRWAQVALLTGLGVTSEDAETLHASLRLFGFTGETFATPTRATAATTPRGETVPAGTPVLLTAAIARPDAFRRTAEELGYQVVGELRFPDHHAYPKESLHAIQAELDRCGAEVVLTTSKDRVKLGLLEAPLAEIPIRCEPDEEFWSWLDPRVDRLLAEARNPGDAR